MFVYGTIPKPKPHPPPLEHEPEPKKKSLPPPPPPAPKVQLVVDVEVEYFRKTLNICLLWVILWIQLALWVIILVSEIVLIGLTFAHNDERNIKNTSIFGLVGPFVFFMEATILSIFTVKEPRGGVLGTAMGFQAASAVFGIVTFDISLRLLFFTTADEVLAMVSSPSFNNTINHPIGGIDIAIATFSSVVAIVSLFYILSCIFIVLLFCGGACCGTLNGNTKRVSGSPILISTTISSNSPIASSTFTASLSSTSSSPSSQPIESGPRQSQGQNVSHPAQDHTTGGPLMSNPGGDVVGSSVKGKSPTGDLNLNQKLIRILLWVQAVFISLALIFGITAAGLEEYIFYPHFLTPSTIWYEEILSFLIFGVAIGLTYFAAKQPSGPRTGAALGFQIASAVISISLITELIYILSISSGAKPVQHLSHSSVGMYIVVILLMVPVLISSCMISIQFCRVSCCGRVKVNQISYCDIEAVVMSEYMDLK